VARALAVLRVSSADVKALESEGRRRQDVRKTIAVPPAGRPQAMLLASQGRKAAHSARGGTRSQEVIDIEVGGEVVDSSSSVGSESAP